MDFVDTHVHLDDDAFAAELTDVIESSRAAGVTTFVNIGYEPESWTKSLKLAQRFPDVWYALGLHPNSADRWEPSLASQLERLLGTTAPVAVGEIGLDFYREMANPSLQRAAFRGQLALANQLALPVIIHMRGDVEDEIIETLMAYPDVRAIFHSFDASPRLRDFALERQHLLGVGGLMTRSGSGALRDTLSAVPIESILLETDAPYLTPRGVKLRRNTPANIPLVAIALAELRSISVEEIAAQTTRNAMDVFGRKSSAAL